MSVKFSDGMIFDTSIKARIVRKSDGLYIVGDGIICPINSLEEGKQILESFKKK